MDLVEGAINELVKDLKSNNLWDKMEAIYPFVGGTVSSRRFNLKAIPKWSRIDKINKIWINKKDTTEPI